MKTSEQQTDQSNEFAFYRQRRVKSPTNKSNSNYINTDFATKPLISRIQINFPTIKICESRKDLTEDSIDNIDKSVTNDHSYFPLGTNALRTKQNSQQQTLTHLTHYQPKSLSPHKQQYTNKRQRSPVRYNEYSYQQTTKEDYSQNNTPSYHDFFKVPIQLNNAQIQPFIHVPPSLKNLELQRKNQKQHKSIDPFMLQPREDYKNLLTTEQTNKNHKFQPILTSPKSHQKLIQTPIKQKGNLTLSQLLTDLQKRSQKLYEIYGQNNQDYQKCLQTIQKNENSHLEKPSLFEQHKKPYSKIQLHEFQLPQQTYAYTDAKSDHYDSWKELQSRKQFDFDKKSFETHKNEFTKKDQSMAQTSPKFLNQMKDRQWTDQLIFEKKNDELATYTPVKIKNQLNYDKPYESADKKMMPSLQNFQTSTKGIITTSKSLSKQSSSIMDKKKKVMFFNEQNSLEQTKVQKVRQFVDKITRFLNRILINYIKANYFYETGVLSTQSNIHATSGRNAEELMGDKSKESNRETSFFQEYFEKKDKNTAEVIVCNMMGGGIRNDIIHNESSSTKKTKQQDIMTPYGLVPIQEQLQSSYGLSMMGKSQQKKLLHELQKQSVVYGQQEQKGSRRNDQETESRFRDHVNSSQCRKVQELLIYSVDKNFLKNNLVGKKEAQVVVKRREIDLQRFALGLDRIVELMKYKVLTQVRYGYLNLKFINLNYSGKGGISSLKISQVGKHSRQSNEKSIEQSKTPIQTRQQQITYRTTNIITSNTSHRNGVPSKQQNQQMPRSNPTQCNQIHQPRNMLEHYYKKSTPNSLTNEYSSIIDERQASPGRNRINSGHEKVIHNQVNEIKMSHFVNSSLRQVKLQHKVTPLQQGPYLPIQQVTPLKQGPYLSIQQSNSLKQSHFMSNPINAPSPQILQQDYYAIGLTTKQQSKLSRHRTSRALSSASSKVTITHGTPTIHRERITKESLLSMRQSQLPLYSPASTGSKFGHNLIQQQSVQRKESVDPLMRQSHMMSREVYASGIHQVPIGSNSTSSIKNCQMFHNPQTIVPKHNPFLVLRPLQPQQKKLDYYTSKGKISRSYSETDFKNYQHHFNKQLNTIRPADSIQLNPLNYGTQQLNMASSMMGRQRAETMMGYLSDDQIRRSNIYDHQINAISNVKSSGILNNQMKASNIVSYKGSSNALRNANYSRPPSSSIPHSPNLSSQNVMTIANIPPPNSKTIRPLINPSMQKRRSQSVSSLIHGPSILNGMNAASNGPNMLKELEGKPFIQFRHQNTIRQQQMVPLAHLDSRINQGIHTQNQLNNHMHRVMNHEQMVQNRPRVSKSMDQCMLRPSSFSGYTLGKSIAGINQPYHLQHQLQFSQNSANVVSHQHPVNHIQQLSRPGSNFVSASQNLVMSPLKTIQKQVEVDSEYHMLKNDYHTISGNRQSSQAIPMNGVGMNTPMKRSNEMMKGVRDGSINGSRVKYEEQNLIMKNQVSNKGMKIKNQLQTPHKSPQHMWHKQPQQMPTYQIAQKMVESPQHNFQIPLSRTALSPSIKGSSVTGDNLGTVNIPKPKSPGILPKTRSPEAIKGKPQSVKPKQGRLSNYGQM